MKFQSIEFKPRAEIRFTQREIALMKKSAAHHYDGRCKDVATRDGLADGMRNCHRNTPSGYVLDWHEIDTLAKICENHICHFKTDDRRTVFCLNMRLHDVLQKLNEATPEPIVQNRKSQIANRKSL